MTHLAVCSWLVPQFPSPQQLLQAALRLRLTLQVVAQIYEETGLLLNIQKSKIRGLELEIDLQAMYTVSNDADVAYDACCVWHVLFVESIAFSAAIHLLLDSVC